VSGRSRYGLGRRCHGSSDLAGRADALSASIRCAYYKDVKYPGVECLRDRIVVIADPVTGLPFDIGKRWPGRVWISSFLYVAKNVEQAGLGALWLAGDGTSGRSGQSAKIFQTPEVPLSVQSATATITRAVTAAGVYALGHLRELTQYHCESRRPGQGSIS